MLKVIYNMYFTSDLLCFRLCMCVCVCVAGFGRQRLALRVLASKPRQVWATQRVYLRTTHVRILRNKQRIFVCVRCILARKYMFVCLVPVLSSPARLIVLLWNVLHEIQKNIYNLLFFINCVHRDRILWKNNKLNTLFSFLYIWNQHLFNIKYLYTLVENIYRLA